mgnify:FL=1
MLVVLGFNGKQAARMKEAFIEAFNMMEEKLRNPLLRLPMQQQLEILSEHYRIEKEKREALEAEVVEMETPAAQAECSWSKNKEGGPK